MAACKIVRFDFRNTLVTFNGVEFEGLAKESDAISVEYREDGGTLEVSADGVTGLHVANNDISGTATIKLSQASETNDYLHDKYVEIKRGTNSGYGSLFIRDLNRNEHWRLAPAFVHEHSEYAYGTEANMREWTFLGVCLEKFDGGTIEIVAGGTL